jgi:L-threonylcarbamoyladenylate synthase
MDIPLIQDVDNACTYIAQGRVVAFPTGTAYGLAVDALQGHALQRLRNLKKRSKEKTFTIFLVQELWKTYLDLSDNDREILSKYENSALTLLVTPKEPLMHLAQDGTIGLRIIDHPVMAELAGKTRVPLTATSANISGEEACYDPEHVRVSFPNQDGTTYDLSLACILDGGKLKDGAISTIAKLENGKIVIVRQGSLKLDSSIVG